MEGRRRDGDPLRHLLYGGTVLAAVIALGTAGYVLIEGWSAFDALYMTVTTVTTVGYREVNPLSPAGRGFTIALILTGVGTLFYVLGNLARFALEGELQYVFGKYRSGGKVKTLRDHYIVCGYGRMGRHICKELGAKPVSVVVVEKSPEVVAVAQGDGFMAVEGDATQDHILAQAGIERAKGLVSVVNSDAENVYIVLTARGLNRELYIVARAGEEGSEQKLMRAGANRVSSPYLIGGMQVAQVLLRPAVVDFLDLATKSEHLDLQIEEITIGKGSQFDGKTPCQCGLDKDRGLIVVGVKRRSGHLEFNPGPQVTLAEGDTLIVLGEPQSLKMLNAMLQSRMEAQEAH
ncbi:MAG TPA: potassium channel protein [Nitrospira sp.]|nr:potassium channel protein [Nitrospira sp.]